MIMSSHQTTGMLEPLKIACSTSDCARDLHCFKRDRRKKGERDKPYRNDRCVSCNIDLIDWKRLDKQNLSDVVYTAQALKIEWIRHHYWHVDIDEKAQINAREMGLAKLQEQVVERIQKSVGPPSSEIWRDGTQTPPKGNVIFYAQHATASCCRKCAEEWHGIDRNRSLEDGEIQYMTDLIMFYIKDRMPDLKED